MIFNDSCSIYNHYSFSFTSFNPIEMNVVIRLSRPMSVLYSITLVHTAPNCLTELFGAIV